MDRFYVGIKGEQPVHGHGGPLGVGVRGGGSLRALEPPPDAPAEGAWCEWGYAGRGPAELARAILTDVLGFPPPEPVSLAFMLDVVKGLPKGQDFELPLSAIQRWLSEQLNEAC